MTLAYLTGKRHLPWHALTYSLIPIYIVSFPINTGNGKTCFSWHTGSHTWFYSFIRFTEASTDASFETKLKTTHRVARVICPDPRGGRAQMGTQSTSTSTIRIGPLTWTQTSKHNLKIQYLSNMAVFATIPSLKNIAHCIGDPFVHYCFIDRCHCDLSTCTFPTGRSPRSALPTRRTRTPTRCCTFPSRPK